MAYLLALSSAALYGTADFLCGLASRRANTLVIVVTSQGCGLTLLVLSLPLLPAATPAARDLVWGGAAGLAGGVGVTLLYRALAVGRMAVVAPTTAVCAVTIPVVTSVVLRAVSTSVRQPVSEFTEAPPRARSGKGPGRREAVAVCL